MGGEEKGVEKESRDWLTADLRQGPQSSRPPKSLQHRACAEVPRYLPWPGSGPGEGRLFPGQSRQLRQ